MHTRPALPCPGAAPAQRGGGGRSRLHPRPGRSARLSPATAAALAPCVAPAMGGRVVSAAGRLRLGLAPARLSSGTCCRRGRCASLPTSAPAPGAAVAASGLPGPVPVPPPPHGPIRPGTAPHVTAPPGPPPRAPSLGKAQLQLVGRWARGTRPGWCSSWHPGILRALTCKAKA